jgi:hypothetical protein
MRHKRQRLPAGVVLCALIVLCEVSLTAQNKYKPWTSWTKAEVEKILNDSAWGQTQVETDTSEMVFTPTTQTGGGDSASRREQGATNQAVTIKFRIRWLSARPIRQALVRQEQLASGKLNEKLLEFASGPSESRIAIAVSFDTADQRFGSKVMKVFESANTDVLKNSTYLELKTGQRIFLQQYVPPQQNALRVAVFVFPRMVDGKPVINPDYVNVRFHSDFENITALDPGATPGQTTNPRQNTNSLSRIANQNDSHFSFKLDMKFKIAEMVYNGSLEY